MTKPDQLELPPLGYSFDALEPAYSSELLELHYSKHHQGYVNGANDVLEAIAEAQSSGEFKHIRQLQKDLAFNLSGHVLHSLFWSNMRPAEGGDSPPDGIKSCVNDCFGSMDDLREHFLAVGTSTQGSGWAALAWQPATQSLVVEQIYDHQDNTSIGSTPVLVMDMWEHAFYLQYNNEKKRWAKAFWDLVNWSDVDTRLADIKKSGLTA